LDVHQAVIVACLLVGKAAGKVHKEVRSFASTTAGLLALRDWLKDAGRRERAGLGVVAPVRTG